MMKKIALLMALVLFVLSVSTAFAWTCPNCNMENDSKFCPECGMKKPQNICPGCGINHGDAVLKFCTECGTKMDGSQPAPTPTVPVMPNVNDLLVPRVQEHGNGTITIEWDAEPDKLYTIECILSSSNDPMADRNANNGFGTSQGKYTGGKQTISRLIPGANYWIGLFDEDGKGQYVFFEPKEMPSMFREFSIVVDGKLMVEKDGVQTEAEHVTGRAIQNGEKVGLYLAMDYNNPGKDKEYVTQIMIEAPDGPRWVMAGKLDFEGNNAGTTGWRFLDLTGYFARMQDCYGMIFMGNYTVTVYVNGDMVDKLPFRVERQDAVKVTSLPTAQPSATVVEPANIDWLTLKTNADGTAEAVWTGGRFPYRVQCTEKRSDSYEADQEAEDGFGKWIAAEDVKETSCTLRKLVPGRDYWITVIDANGRSRYAAYQAAVPEKLEGYSAALDIIPRSMVGETTENLRSIPVNKAGMTDDTAYGAYLWLDYVNPGEPQEMLMQMVLTLPNGAVRVVKSSDVTLESGGHSAGWNFCDLEEYFSQVLARFGAIPAGDAQVDCYLDGKLAATGTLPLRDVKPLTVKDLMLLNNGHVYISWEDNGNAPYDVYYHERFSGDAQADLSDGRSSGRWIAQEGLTGTSLDIIYLIPGKSYWLTLEDSIGGEKVLPCFLQPAGDSEMNMTCTASARIRRNEQLEDQAAFSAAELNHASDAEHGLYISLTYDKLPADGQKPSMWVLTLPNGVSFCEYSFDMNVFAGGSTYWEFYSLDWAFEQVKRLFGEVMQGEYTFTLYVEGDYACTTGFTVAE